MLAIENARTDWNWWKDVNTIDAQVAVGVHVTGTPVVKLKLELKQAMKAIARSPVENLK